MTIRHYGVSGLQRAIRDHVAWAQWFAEQVRGDDRFELVADPPLSLVCFRLRGADEANERLLTQLNASGAVMLSHTRLEGRFTLRLSVGATLATRAHVEGAWRAVRELAERLESGRA